MNKKLKYFGLVLAMASFAVAQEAAPEAAAVQDSAQTQNASTELVAEAPQPVAQNDSTTTPTVEEPAQDVAAVPANETAPVEGSTDTAAVAAPAEQVEPEPSVEAMPAPVAVRGVNAEAKPVYEENVVASPVEEPSPVRERRVYRISAEPVPMKFTFGAQGFIGTNSLLDNNWDFSESYSGIAWKAGLFAVIPLNEYTMGFRIGALFDYSDASASYFYGSSYEDEARVKFKMQRLTVPLLFMLKSTYSSFSFDFGVQFSVPLVDEFKYSYDVDENVDGAIVRKEKTGNADMIGLDYRSSMDFALVMGLSIKANRYMSFDIRYECGFSNLYESVPGWRINDLSANTLLFGLSFYVL